MHLTLHITTDCNFRCSYCYSPNKPRNYMTAEVAEQAVRFGAERNNNLGIVFFGGEPLLHKNLIYSTMDFASRYSKEKGFPFHYKMTTNGSLLDDQFLKYSVANHIHIALSADGNSTAHDLHRKTAEGESTFALIEDKFEMLLRHQPYCSVLLVVTPATVDNYCDSVRYLIGKGFRYIIASLNYAGAWTDKDLEKLEKQYRKLSKLYEQLMEKEEKIYFSPFDMKFETHIKEQYGFCHKCVLAQRQISVAWNGDLYPCVQFVQDGSTAGEYCIGNVWDGIDEKKLDELTKAAQYENEACSVCALKGRCNNSCNCLNWQVTRSINTVPAVLCETEKILIRVTDDLGNRLFRKRNPMFIQKHYNAMYPILSLIEDSRQ